MKRFLIFMIMISMALSLVGCGKQVATVEVAEETVEEEPVKEEVDEKAKEAEEPADKKTVETNNASLKNNQSSPNYSVFLYSGSDLQSVNGFFAKKGSNFYSLGKTKYNNKICYVEANRRRKTGSTELNGLSVLTTLSPGDPNLPLVSISKRDGDELVFVSDKVFEMNVYRATDYGYTIGIARSDFFGDEYADLDGKLTNYRNIETYVCEDTYPLDIKLYKGDVELDLINRYQLKHNDSYSLGYYVGTRYNEVEKKANHPCYAYMPTEPAYVVTPKLGKNAYSTIDISNFENGIYVVSNFYVFRIVD